MDKNVAFIGLGIMGKPMARNLLNAGYTIHAYTLEDDILAEIKGDGAQVYASSTEAAQNAKVAITMVPNGPQSLAAILGDGGVLAGMQAGGLIIDMSSIAPGVSQELAAACEAKGVHFLDAPVSGGEPMAVSGQLAIMVGGKKESFEVAKPLFEVLGKSAVFCGDYGAGNTTKLANQIVVAANILAVAEALVLATKAGVDPETVFEAIKGGLAGSTVMNAKAPMMIGRNFQPGFRIELHNKDINNAMETVQKLGLKLDLTADLQKILAGLMEAGDGGLDHSGILRHVERATGVEVKKL